MNSLIKGTIALAVLIAGGEVFRLWWFSDARALQATAALTPEVLQFHPDAAASEVPSAWTHNTDVRQQKIVDGLLGHDRSVCGTWQDRSADFRWVHYTWVEYDAGNTRYLRDLFGHPPEVCVGKSGAKRLAIHPNRTLEIMGRELAVRHVEFADPISGIPFQIFKFVWLPEASPLQFDDGRSEQALRRARLNAAWHGMPRSEARMLIAVVVGADGAEQGWTQFERTVAASLSAGPVHSEGQQANRFLVD